MEQTPKYLTLFRRLDDPAVVDRQFKYLLRKWSPSDFKDVDRYFNAISTLTAEYVVEYLFEHDLITRHPKQVIIKIKKEVIDYLRDTLFYYAEMYFDK